MDCMSELFKKLNVLIKSNLLGEDKKSQKPVRLGKEFDREIEGLRGRIQDALNHEKRLKGQLRQIEDEILQWDQAADDALRANAEEGARTALEKLRSAKRRYARLEDDLHQHEIVTQELIQKVNLLESVVTKAREEQPNNPERSIADVLSEAREKIATLGELRSPKAEIPNDAPPPVEEVNDDLEQRRQRLSRR